MKFDSEPTLEECSNNRVWVLPDGSMLMACYYPQMGGYCGRCVVHFDPCGEPSCFDVYVWHDGEFPFGEDTYPGKPPIELHHCDPEQFIRFGKLVCDVMTNPNIVGAHEPT